MLKADNEICETTKTSEKTMGLIFLSLYFCISFLANYITLFFLAGLML